MPLLALPNELLLQIARGLLQSQTCQCDSDRHCDCDCDSDRHCDRDCDCSCNCHCHHMSPHLSAFSRVNHRLHALLAEYLLDTASTLHMLLWAVANSRTDTVALALDRGADPNSPLRPNAHWNRDVFPVELAISMRAHSLDAQSHALKLRTLALLFAAGGTCTVDSLINPTCDGDLDLLTISLPHLTNIEDSNDPLSSRILLEIAACRGYVEATKLVIAAGAPVNSTGVHNDPGYYPALWVCWSCPITTLQVLLDAGADATWRNPRGVSLVGNMRLKSVNTPELKRKIELLVRYGAIDSGAAWLLGRPGGGQRNEPPKKEYRGWVPDSKKVPDSRKVPGSLMKLPISRKAPVDWAQEWVMMGSAEGCRCHRFELQITGTGE